MPLRPVTAAAAALVLCCGPAMAEPEGRRLTTTRIETRPAYGAITSMEGGVRVIRALPPTHHVIVNPHGRTPLHLSVQDIRVTEHRAELPAVVQVTPAAGLSDGGAVILGDGRHGARDRFPHRRPLRHHP